LQNGGKNISRNIVRHIRFLSNINDSKRSMVKI